MISVPLHLMACIALVLAAGYGRIHALQSDLLYRHMRPFIVAAGIFSLVILYKYVMVFFIAFYSGVSYDGGPPTRGQLAKIAVSLLLSLLPLLALIPAIGRNLLMLMLIGSLAAAPDIVWLVSRPSDQPSGQNADSGS